MDSTWLICAVVLALGCTIQTAMGFGMAIIAAPIMVIVAPQWVPYVLAIMALVLSIGNALQQRQHIDWSAIYAPMLTRIPGTLVGTWLLLIMPVAWLQIAVALMVFMTIVVSLWVKPFQPSRKNLGIAGFVSGITGTTTSIGGPPMALVMQHSGGGHTRANLAVYFIFSCVISLVSYIAVGLFTVELFWQSTSFLPFAVVGYLAGKKLQALVDNRFRPILLGLCAVSASVAFINAFISGL